MGVAPAPEELPLPKFLDRVAATGAPQTSQQNGLLGAGPPAVPPHARPEVLVPRNYDPDAPAPEDLAAAAVPRNYDPDAPVPAPAPDGVPRNYNANGSELPAALNAVGLAAAGW